MKKQVYLIGGPMGSGKTTIGQLLKKELSYCAFLDGDWCWDMDPFQITDATKKMVIQNIVFLLNQFIQCPDYQNVVFVWVMHQQAIIDEIVQNLPIEGCDYHTISLMIDEGSLRNQLEKDVLSGIRQSTVIDRSLSYLPLYQKLDTVKVNVSKRPPDAIVDELIERIEKRFSE